MKVKILVAVNHDKFNQQIVDALNQLNLSDVTFEAEHLQKGPTFIARRYDEHSAIESLVQAAERAEKEGFHGIFISSFGDTGVKIVREAVNIPVLGAFLPSLLTANLISQTYAIITIAHSVKPICVELAREYGLQQNLIGTYVIDMDLSNLKSLEVLLPALIKSSHEAIKDGAQSIILGCTGMTGVAQDLAKSLLGEGFDIPVIDPSRAAIMQLYSLIKQSLVQSSLSYYKSVK